jgi:hypothetical protein
MSGSEGKAMFWNGRPDDGKKNTRGAWRSESAIRFWSECSVRLKRGLDAQPTASMMEGT